MSKLKAPQVGVWGLEALTAGVGRGGGLAGEQGLQRGPGAVGRQDPTGRWVQPIGVWDGGGSGGAGRGDCGALDASLCSRTRCVGCWGMEVDREAEGAGPPWVT